MSGLKIIKKNDVGDDFDTFITKIFANYETRVKIDENIIQD
jgi:hypothetical protein